MNYLNCKVMYWVSHGPHSTMDLGPVQNSNWGFCGGRASSSSVSYMEVKPYFHLRAVMSSVELSLLNNNKSGNKRGCCVTA